MMLLKSIHSNFQVAKLARILEDYRRSCSFTSRSEYLICVECFNRAWALHACYSLILLISWRQSETGVEGECSDGAEAVGRGRSGDEERGDGCGDPGSSSVWCSVSGALSGESSGCTRPFIDVLTGFAVTLLALGLPFYSSNKHSFGNKAEGIVWGVILGVCATFVELGDIVYVCINAVEMQQLSRWWIGSVTYVEIICIVTSMEESRIRILASCDVVVFVSVNSELLRNAMFNEMLTRGEVADESEAMVFGDPAVGADQGGPAFADGKVSVRVDGVTEVSGDTVYQRRELYFAGGGIIALELAKVLPAYDQLKFLRINSSFAMIAIMIQAIGYLYAVVYRSFTDLRVAPLEVIGLVFNIVLLIKGIIFTT